MRHHTARWFLGRWRTVRSSWISALQAGVAAGLAWWVATSLLPSEEPFYAIIGAIVAIGAGENRLARRSVTLLAGMLTAVAFAGVTVQWTGTGEWQIVAIATATTLLGRLLFDDPLARSYSSFYGALIGAMGASGFVPDRLLEAAVGAVSGLVVAHVFFPPRVDRAIFDPLGHGLRSVRRALKASAAALRSGSLEDIQKARRDTARAEAEVSFNDRRRIFARQLTKLSPIRWRDRQEARAAIEVDRRLTPVLIDAASLARNGSRLAEDRKQSIPGESETLELIGEALGEVVAAIEYMSYGGESPAGRADALRNLPERLAPEDPSLVMLSEEAGEVAQAIQDFTDWLPAQSAT